MAKSWAKSFYNSKNWKDCRDSYILKVKGLCERCLKKNRIINGKIVHHKIHLNSHNINDPYVSLNHDNLEYLCQDCHNDEHHSQDILEENLYFDENGNLQELDSPHSENF